MGWRDNLQPASFRSVKFHIDGHEFSTGRRGQQHEYPQRDKPYFEDLGRKSRDLTFDAFVIGDDYMAARDALLRACETEGPGALVHPYLGTFDVVCTDCRLSERKPDGGLARFSLSFSEAGEIRFPTSAVDTVSSVEAAASATLLQAQAEFASAHRVAGLPGFVASSSVDAGTSLVESLTGYAGSDESFLTAAETFTADLSATVRNATTFASQMTGLIESAAAAAANPLSMARRLSEFAVETAGISAFTSTRVQQLRNLEAVQNLVRVSALTQEALALTGTTYASLQDATNALSGFTDRLDGVVNVAAVSGASTVSSPWLTGHGTYEDETEYEPLTISAASITWEHPDLTTTEKSITALDGLIASHVARFNRPAVTVSAGDYGLVNDPEVEALGEIALSLIPGVGEALSARDAYQAFAVAHAAMDDGQVSDAMWNAGFGLIAAAGAIPGIGYAFRLARAGVKASRLFFKLLSARRAAGKGLPAPHTSFDSWARHEVKTTARHSRFSRVGKIDSSLQSLLSGKGVTLTDLKIIATDDRIYHVRPGRKNLTESQIAKMPDHIAAPKAVLWDKTASADTILFIFDSGKTGSSGKWVVRLNDKFSINTGSGARKVIGNRIVTGGVIDNANLNDSNTYDLLSGAI